MVDLKQYPRLWAELQAGKKSGSKIVSYILAGVLILLGLFFLFIVAKILPEGKKDDIAVMIFLGILALIMIGSAVYLITEQRNKDMAVKDSWRKADAARMNELDEKAAKAIHMCGCLLYDDCLVSRTEAGDVYRPFEDILWVYGIQRRRSLNGVPILTNHAVNAVDIDGNDIEVMHSADGKEADSRTMTEVLVHQMHEAGYYPVIGYDGQLQKDTKKDLNILKRRYEQSMNEQFEREARTAKWICPHCTAENDGGTRCVYCGCLKEIKIPDEPVAETPVRTEAPQEPVRDYSNLAPNTPAKRSNPMLAVLLGLACVAVMGISLLIANHMGGPKPTEPDTPPVTVTDPEPGTDPSKLLDGEVGDTLETAFFDFKFNSVKKVSSYEGITPADGNQLIVANVTIHNTMRSSLPMFDSDFLMVYGDGDNDYAYPVTFDDASKASGEMLESEYSIGINKTVTGDLVYEIPADITSGYFYFEEYFDNGEYGEYYTVSFNL